jgi:hypothetical protein|tara:strand:+ start:1565 stop:1759 length:195 start_codon:yes stop_codon:yes gene_type:complete
MEYVLILMLGMFREDNAEFFDQKPSSDKKWVYVGKQAPIKGMANLTSVNPETGEQSIYFQLQDK